VPPSSLPLPPRYHLEKELGRGGMGIVYRVYDTHMGQQVALKTIQPKHAQNNFVVTQFNHEIDIMKRVVGHPYIVSVLDQGVLLNNLPYFTMSYIEGDDLKKIIFDTGRTLTLNEIHDLLEQIGSALAYAHGQAVKHRDIKPSNIIKSKEGRFFLTDFGIAIGEWVKSHPQIHDTRTEEYAAPEVLNKAPSTPCSDVYSLGMTLIEVFLNSRFAEAKRQTNGAPFSILEHNHAYIHFVPILKKAIEPDPQRRYASIADFAHDFAQTKRRLEMPSTIIVRPQLPMSSSRQLDKREEFAKRLGIFFVGIILVVLLLAIVAAANLPSAAS
jgi:serine/threonine protein kinase